MDFDNSQWTADEIAEIKCMYINGDAVTAWVAIQSIDFRALVNKVGINKALRLTGRSLPDEL